MVSVLKSWIKRIVIWLLNFFLVILFIAIPTMIVHDFGRVPKQWTLGNIILAYTGWVILLYTLKTWQLKDLTSKQISFSIRPLIIFEPRNCIIRNIGKGVALDINIKDIPTKGCEGNFALGDDESSLPIKFESIGFLAQGEQHQGVRMCLLTESGQEKPLPSALHNAIHDINHKMRKIPMCIEYKDIDKRIYKTYMDIKDKAFTVTKVE